MNIFYLNKNYKTCAEYHTNKHLISQIKESCQLLSTAHRVLDGVQYIDSSSGRRIKRWKLGNSYENILYKATHVNHPSAIWVRQSEANYRWLVSLLSELCKEYTYRYGKTHKCEYSGLVDLLYVNSPRNISNRPFTEPTPAMPDIYKVNGDSVQSYINYYIGDKQRMFNWKNREIPHFIKGQINANI